MEWNGLWGLFYGLLSGFFEFLPASPQAHQLVLQKLTGLPSPGFGMAFAVHLGALAAVLLSYYPLLGKYRREQKLRRQPRRSRTRQPDAAALMEYKLLKIAAVPVVLSCLASSWLSQYFQRLWVLALLVIFNGVVVFLPHYMSHANKEARTMSPLDATLIGLSGMLGALPGFSRVGSLNAVASMRGLDGQFAVKFVFLMMIPALVASCLGDLGMLVLSGNTQNHVPFITAALACFAAFAAAMAVIRLMRFLSVKGSFEALAYYNWGLAMFTFIIYLIG
ncbi:MAG: undecaprenyl-diphosphate phosphatase [Ruminococcaceae bacterium]|nr:undecaprenyl-diphosphate phosphatase [Oscillospiraceae bacterium]